MDRRGVEGEKENRWLGLKQGYKVVSKIGVERELRSAEPTMTIFKCFLDSACLVWPTGVGIKM